MRRMYSQNQIKEMIKESPSEVVEALKGQDINVNGITSKGIATTGAITGKSLDITNPAKSFNLVLSNIPEGLSINERFMKAHVSCGLLLIIASFTATNNTESSISFTSPQIDFEVDNATGDKIICANGDKLSDEMVGSEIIIANMISSYGSNFTMFNSRKITKVGKNQVRLFLSGASVGAGATEQYIGRQWLSLM